MSDEPEIRYLGDLQRLERKPGDIFVLTVPGVVSVETADRLRDMFTENIGAKVIILCDGMKLGIVNAEAA